MTYRNVNGRTNPTHLMATCQRFEADAVNIPAHLENSLEVVKCIQAGDLTTNKLLPYSPCSLDVVSLYRIQYLYKKPPSMLLIESTSLYSTSPNEI